jgi:hypothetical protein
MMNPGDWERNALGYTTVEMLLDDVSKQMEQSNLTRYFRSSGSQKAGGSMRIAKPNSTSNSPRGSTGLGRRRTVMTDGAYRRRLAMIDQNVMAAGGFVSSDGLQTSTPTARPVSWHPASHMAQQQYESTYHVEVPNITNPYQMFDLPPTPAVYSGYTSPSSTFSPLSAPFNGYEQPQYPFLEPPTSSHTGQNYPGQEQSAQNYLVSSNENVDSSTYSHLDWNNFAVNGFDRPTTSPPTPENFLPIQHPDPSFPTEESIPYHPLSDDEPEGEELIGMGLYDSPEVAKTPSSDPHLDNYRSTMISQLWGSPHRLPEPTGKGLKLEETWSPPASDDGDDEDDDERDGEGEDDDEPEEMVKHSTTQTTQTIAVSISKPDALAAQKFQSFTGNDVPTQPYDRNRWL